MAGPIANADTMVSLLPRKVAKPVAENPIRQAVATVFHVRPLPINGVPRALLRPLS